MYRVIYEKRVCKDLDNIPDPDVIRILKVFDELSLNPVLDPAFIAPGRAIIE